jgi:hypothetical protein
MRLGQIRVPAEAPSSPVSRPFLAALCLWHMPRWRYFFLAATVFFGAVVLLGHYHYSIDVLAALFITHAFSRFRAGCSARTWRCCAPRKQFPKSRSARSAARPSNGLNPAGKGLC